MDSVTPSEDLQPAPLEVVKISMSVADLNAMPADSRSVLLLFGLFLNEANWLRKLLVKAALGIGDTPEGQANFSLTIMLATTLAGKIHEGWDTVVNGKDGKIKSVLEQIQLPESLNALKTDISARLSDKDRSKTLLRIRNSIGFHYEDRVFDFSKLATHLSDSDVVLYATPAGFGGDILSHISTLAALEPIMAVVPEQDYKVALETVWNEVTAISAAYCQFLSEIQAVMITQFLPNQTVENITITDAPVADAERERFFLHPPKSL